MENSESSKYLLEEADIDKIIERGWCKKFRMGIVYSQTAEDYWFAVLPEHNIPRIAIMEKQKVQISQGQMMYISAKLGLVAVESVSKNRAFFCRKDDIAEKIKKLKIKKKKIEKKIENLHKFSGIKK